MSFRLSGLAALCLFAAGCSSMHSLLAFDRPPPAPIVAAAPVAVAPVPAAPEPAAARPDEWCVRVAANDRAQAGANGFNAATQDRMTLQSYQQCAALKAQ